MDSDGIAEYESEHGDQENLKALPLIRPSATFSRVTGRRERREIFNFFRSGTFSVGPG